MRLGEPRPFGAGRSVFLSEPRPFGAGALSFVLKLLFSGKGKVGKFIPSGNFSKC